MYQKILVPLDGSELAECVLPHLEAISKGCGATEAVLMRVVEPSYIPAGTMTSGLDTLGEAQAAELRKNADAKHVEAAKAYLEELAGRVNLGNTKVSTEIVTGNPADNLADYATDSKADLIIIATHGRSGVSRWVWGSVSDRILRSACVPVLMVRAPGCISGI